MFDEPVGKSNGTVNGKKLFECEQNYGGLIRGRNLKCGDFPVRDLMDESDDEHDHEDHTHESEDDDEI